MSSRVIPIQYALVPHETLVGSVLGEPVDLWQDPRHLPEDPGMLAMMEYPTRRVIFVTEFGEGLAGLPTGLLDSRMAYSLATVFPAFRGSIRDRVTESYYAYWWAKNWPEERHLMRGRVTESNPALWWAQKWPEERHLMHDLVTRSRHALWWAKKWPEERHLMRHLVTDPEDVADWNARFPDGQIPIPR